MANGFHPFEEQNKLILPNKNITRPWSRYFSSRKRSGPLMVRTWNFFNTITDFVTNIIILFQQIIFNQKIHRFHHQNILHKRLYLEILRVMAWFYNSHLCKQHFHFLSPKEIINSNKYLWFFSQEKNPTTYIVYYQYLHFLTK